MRIEYIDTLRGFTMLLVVFAHVETFSFFNFSHETFIGTFFQSFRMPLFFFISGFVAYLALQKKMKNSNTKREICNKARVLLIPTFFFGILYTCLYLGKDITFFFSNAAKAGYWFMLVSFEMFVCLFVCLRLTKGSNRLDTLLIALVLFFVVLKLPMKKVDVLCVLGDVTSIHYTLEYFQYFVFGFLSSKYKETFHAYIDKKVIITIIISCFCLLFYLRYIMTDSSDSIYSIIVAFILKFALGYLGILWIYGLIRKYGKYCSTNTKLGIIFNFIGKRTLDIYVLHYFLLPFLPKIGDYLKLNPNLVLELFVGLLLAFMIVIICLAISGMLRFSSTLAYYLFGQKSNQ